MYKAKHKQTTYTKNTQYSIVLSILMLFAFSSASIVSFADTYLGNSTSYFKTKKEKKTYKRIAERFRIPLLKKSNPKQNHRLYINSLNQELVSKGRFGKTHYEFRLKENETKAILRYTF